MRIHYSDIIKSAKVRAVEREEGYYEKFLRILGNPLAYFFCLLRVPANVVTLIGFLIDISGALFFTFGHYIIGFLFFRLGEIIDYTDGTVARAQNQTSNLKCRFLTHWHHGVTPTLILIAGFVNYFFITQNTTIIFLALLVSICQTLTTQIILLRNSLLFRFYHNEAIKQAAISKLYKKGIMKYAFEASIFPVLRIDYIILILFLINPYYFILFYSLFIPFRFIVFAIYSFTHLKKIEDKKIIR